MSRFILLSLSLLLTACAGVWTAKIDVKGDNLYTTDYDASYGGSLMKTDIKNYCIEKGFDNYEITYFNEIKYKIDFKCAYTKDIEAKKEKELLARKNYRPLDRNYHVLFTCTGPSAEKSASDLLIEASKGGSNFSTELGYLNGICSLQESRADISGTKMKTDDVNYLGMDAKGVHYLTLRLSPYTYAGLMLNPN